MKKRVLSAVVALALLFGPMSIKTAKSQIIIFGDEEEEEVEDERDDVKVDDQGLELPITPGLGITIDSFAPLGGEIFVLGLLGGAYLVGKRKRKE